ncbi:MAG: serine/threonine protein kinase [Candidatus Eremiobacteraeota bacterium]|nr:serine/threonine protein kinase [Candidatus Eremiobacteraeota bacterium]MCW5866581.1 serine/threonine protein kinase [Candidatus Eremiobacteraeota bacterium]
MDQADETVFQSGEERRRSSSLSEIPFQLAGYQMRRLIGSGSFGSVYAAIQERTGLQVAVKFLRREVVNWRYFQRELQQLSRLAEHPGVVTLLDADLDHDPPYYVMPLLRGSLAHQTAPSAQVVVWLKQMAQALDYMHGKGVLHCDLKPSNVLLDAEGRTRLVDFGQARSLGDQGNSFGTLGYMPPEQAAGDAQPDVRWDVYGFGATAYRLLTGHYPRFSADDRTSLSVTEDAGERLRLYRELVQSRQLVGLRRLNPKIDEDLAQIVEHCLELAPERRTASLAGVVEDLERRHFREPLLCRRPWSLRYRVNRLLSRPVAALALGVTLVLPLFVNTYLTVKAHHAIVDLALRPVEQANEDGVAHLRDLGEPYSHGLAHLSPKYHHVLLQPEAPELAELQKQSPRLRLAYFEKGGKRWMGAWKPVDEHWTLLSEVEADPWLQSSDDLLQKNLLLNLLILTVTSGTALSLLRFNRS